MKRPMKRAEFKCQAGEAEVWIYDIIGESFWGGGISAKMFLEDLAALGDVDRLTVRINSPGGIVWDALAMFNALVRFPATILTAVDGVAASGASLIAMAGDTVSMAENAHIMIHEAQGYAEGRAADHRKLADRLEKLNETQIATYRNKSKQSEEQIAAWLDEEKWFTAAEAVEAGMADEVTGGLKLAACIPMGVYQKTPEGLEMTPEDQFMEAEAYVHSIAEAAKAANEGPHELTRLERELTLIGP